MPLALDIKLGDNTFHVDGDVEINESLTTLFRSWVNAQSTTSEDIEALTDKLRGNNDALAGVVAEHRTE